ncbi:hypothetical protein J7K43_00105 [Candidatus Calescamantes bacterium]|nr:hypothetical protein [Candidatus Calescamantes bacterium]
MKKILFLLVLVVFSFGAWMSEAKVIYEKSWEDDMSSIGKWASDGHWKITIENGVKRFYKDDDKRIRHNSCAFIRIPPARRKGYRIEIKYRMQVPYKHVDIFVGNNCEYIDRNKPKKPVSNIWSLGGLPSTDWQERVFPITSDEEINTLGFFSWGWEIDCGTWMDVAYLRIRPPRGEVEEKYFTFPEAKIQINTTSSHYRHPIQDFFPFGVYLGWNHILDNYKKAGFSDEWEMMERVLDDMVTRGFNTVWCVNTKTAITEHIIKMCATRNIRVCSRDAEFFLNTRPFEKIEPVARKILPKFRGNQTVLGWVFGEEYSVKRMPELKNIQDLVMELDPSHVPLFIHNKLETAVFAAEKLNCRIIIRDIYPFFADPEAGWIFPNGQLNYFEGEVDKAFQVAQAVDANLWIIPSVTGEYHPPAVQRAYSPTTGYGKWLYAVPTPEQIRVQTWAALAHGAKGIIYYHYVGSIKMNPWGKGFSPWRYDGTESPRQKEMTRLAKELKRLSPIILSLGPREGPVYTSNYDIGAFIYRTRVAPVHRFVIVFNRDFYHQSEAEVMIPDADGIIFDLKNLEPIVSYKAGSFYRFRVQLEPGDGRIYLLGSDQDFEDVMSLLTSN